MSGWGEFGGRRAPRGGTPGEYAALLDLLRTAADALAVDLAVWQARDPAAPSPEARRARRSAIATADAVTEGMTRLRVSLGDGTDGAGT